jgi:hypothetical protein
MWQCTIHLPSSSGTSPMSTLVHRLAVPRQEAKERSVQVHRMDARRLVDEAHLAELPERERAAGCVRRVVGVGERHVVHGPLDTEFAAAASVEPVLEGRRERRRLVPARHVLRCRRRKRGSRHGLHVRHDDGREFERAARESIHDGEGLATLRGGEADVEIEAVSRGELEPVQR